MKSKFITVALGAMFALSAAVLSSNSQADTRVGWYVAADVGQHQSGTQKLTVTDRTIESSSSYSQSSSSSSSNSSSSSSSGSAQGAPARAAAAEVTGEDAYDGPYSLKVKRDTAVFLRGGYAFHNNWRAELELGDRQGEIKQGIATGATTSETPVNAAGRGDRRMTSLMANVIYDIAADQPLHPYIGAGIGAVQVKTDYTGTYGPSESYVEEAYSIRASETVAGYQLIAGLAWSVTDNLDIDLTYRYLQTADLRSNVTIRREYYQDTGYPNPVEDRRASARASAAAAAIPGLVYEETERARMKGRIDDQSLTIGLRWTFGAPPPAYPTHGDPMPPTPPAQPYAAAPVPQAPLSQASAPLQAAHYTVYFPFNSAQIDSEAEALLSEAARYAKSGPVKQVAVVGHADTSGSAAYNVALSERRAKMVADNLVKKGVPQQAVYIGWKGETAPAVSTGNGVKKQENRRATVDVTFE